MDKEKIQLQAFQIISIAGDAYSLFYEAMKCYKENDLSTAIEKQREGSEKLNEAHQIQTELIQAEVNNEELVYSLIMSHAQDHLMMACTWQNMAKLFIGE